MKRTVLLALVAVILVSGCIQQQAQQQAAQGMNTILVKDFAFSPSTLTIKTGTAVTWTNVDAAPHQIASDPHPAHTDLPGLFSDSLSTGQNYSFTFTKSGTFGYHCNIHPSMKGTVIVEE